MFVGTCWSLWIAIPLRWQGCHDLMPSRDEGGDTKRHASRWGQLQAAVRVFIHGRPKHDQNIRDLQEVTRKKVKGWSWDTWFRWALYPLEGCRYEYLQAAPVLDGWLTLGEARK